MSVKDMATEELIKEWKSLNEVVDDQGCFGVADIVRFHLVSSELEKRKYEIKLTRTLIKKEG